MSNATVRDWHEANQRYLMASIGVVRSALEHHIEPHNDDAAEQETIARALTEQW
ncbi:MAG: hypothetical protein JSW39_18690 [Desulfobacterales bacterium]|nr:MAG: hypothetical protein JSW39_18690 [Desulfobacterales bacterium]